MTKCKFYKSNILNSCRKGAKCTFQHIDTPLTPAQTAPDWKSILRATGGGKVQNRFHQQSQVVDFVSSCLSQINHESNKLSSEIIEYCQLKPDSIIVINVDRTYDTRSFSLDDQILERMTLTHNIIGAVQEIFSLNVTLDWPWLNSRRQTYNIVSAPFATCALPWLDFLVSDFLVNHLKSECVMILFGCAWRNFEKFGNQVMINLQNVFQIITSSDSKSIKEFGAWLLSRGLLSFARLMYHIMSRFREAQFSEILQTLSSKLEDLTNAYCVSNITNISRLWSRIMDQALSRVLSIRNHAAGRIIAGNELSEAENLARSIARLELNRASNFATWSGVKLDMPGELSELGPRHENDFADISQIHCIPTLSELLSVRENFLGLSHRNAPHHLEGISRLLDSQFRLLREDLIAPMRNSIRAVACLLMKADTDGVSYSKSLSLNSNGRLMTSIKDRSTKVSQAINSFELNVKLDDIDCIVYTNVSIKTLTCERDAGYSFRVAFQPPQAIMKLGSKGAEEYWDRSRKLSSGAVVVVFMPRQNYDKSKDLNLGIHDWAVNGPFEITFAEIVNHDTRKSHGDCCGGHGQQKHCIVLKNIDISKGSNRVHLSWFELMVTGLMSKKVKSINAPETGFMIEITAVLFNAYIPVLETLKGLSRNVQEMPFQRYLAPEADLKEILVQQPSYSLIDGFSFNFDPLKKAGSESFRYIPSNDLNYNKIALNWLSDNSNLDEGQRQSLLDCLTREVTLIQGAPGTGKTKIGVDIVRVLLASLEKRGPILCICYTNHALDSFLHHLYSIGITEIVRCGSGCKEDELKSFELNTLIKTVRVPRSDSDWDLRDRLKISSDKLDKLLNPLVIDEKNVSNVSDENFSTMVDYFYNNHGKWSNDLFNGPDVSREEEADLEEGYQKVDAKGRKKKAFVDLSPIKKFSYWLRGEDLDTRRHIIRDTVIFEQENLAFMQNIQNSGSKRSKKSKKVSSKILSEEEITKEIENRANLPYSNRDVLELLNFENETNFFEFSKKERCKLHDYWVIKNIADVSLTFCDAAIEDDKLRKMSKIVYQRKCLDVLSKAKVVGMTTTCVAKMQDLVKSMKPEIIICEEAGEVLESHVLTSLHSQAQHLIMIGDHLQLRPKVGQYKLSVDSKEGKNYRLDESLFERLVTKNDHRPEVPMSILRVQRRMRSDISDLIRSPLYPDLVDGENTKIYPDVTGMSQNVFFLDHRHLEDGAGKDSQKQLYAQSSKSNQFECDMIIGLVKHLVKNGYQPGDIAILTPYLGQEHVLVSVDERDEADAEKALKDMDELIDISLPSRSDLGKAPAPVVRTMTKIGDMEEAKIVIISLVRNCPAGKSGSIGFLDSPNRTNVLLSRAKHGLFMLGNAELLKTKSEFWSKVIEILNSKAQVGPAFPLKCELHPETIKFVDIPEKFEIESPQGGCTLPCESRLSCGHICSFQCHIFDRNHTSIYCAKDCMRPIPDCNHPCPLRCGQKCDEKCYVVFADILLPCGHTYKNPKCFEMKDISSIKCRVKVEKIVPYCGHEVALECHQDASEVLCKRRCDSPIKCGHNCKAQCGVCSKLNQASGKIVLVERLQHVPCVQTCDKALHCGHSCLLKCHDGSFCSECVQKCSRKCSHSTCKHDCKTSCSPCLEVCGIGCAHRGFCQLPCDYPCVQACCDELCEKILECGHRCQSICSEICICVECIPKSERSERVDLIMMSTLADWSSDDGPLIKLLCGHVFTVETLDGVSQQKQKFSQKIDWSGCTSESIIVCPTCRSPLNSQRYIHAIKLSSIGKQKKIFEISLNQKLLSIKNQIEKFQIDQKLNLSEDKIVAPSAPSIRIVLTMKDEIDDFNLDPSTHGIFDKMDNTQWRKRITILTAILVRLREIFSLSNYNFIHLINGAAVVSMQRLDSTDVSIVPYEKIEFRFASESYQMMAECVFKMAQVLEFSLRNSKKSPSTKWSSFCLDLYSYAQNFFASSHLVAKTGLYRSISQQSRLKWSDAGLRKFQFLKYISGLDLISREVSARNEILGIYFKYLEEVLNSILQEIPSTDILNATNNLRDRIPNILKALMDSKLSEIEMKEIRLAMRQEFGGSGHWYTCPNGHSYTIGECGMAMEVSRCPDCGATIGGSNHTSAAGNSRDMVNDGI